VTYHPLWASVDVSIVDGRRRAASRRSGSARSFVAGDVLGARLYEDGELQVYRNHAWLGSVKLNGWYGNSMGGFVGIVLDHAPGAAFDNFGGGDVVSAATAPPVAVMLAPADHAFYAAGDTIHLDATSGLGPDTLTTR